MNYAKNINLKTLGSNQKIDPAQMQKINSFALRELTADEVYVRQFFLAHNGIDRDNERFPNEVLKDFQKTLPGKSVLQSHDRSDLPKGLFYNAFTDTMSVQGFKTLTSEDIRLPDGISQAMVLFGWAYFIKNIYSDELLNLLDAGIARYVSIGFRATDLITITGPQGQTLYREYLAPAEALEGSIVWLGAQPGAMIKSPAASLTPDGKEPINWRVRNPLTPREEGEKKVFVSDEKGQVSWKIKNPLTPEKQEDMR